jgi:putative hemolysin
VAALATAFAISTVALVAALRASPSEAQAGAMHDCPPSGKWSVAIWTGDNGTDPGQAFSSCGEGAIEAAYSLDPDTQVWSRWFLGAPEVSNLSVVDDMQAVLALASAQIPVTPVAGLPNPASVYCVELGYQLTILDEPEGQVGMCVFPDTTQCEEWSFFEGECGQAWAMADEMMHNCPQPGKWAIAVWNGAGLMETGEAFSTCDTATIDAAYYLDPETQLWSRWFFGKPEISNLSSVDHLQGLMALGGAAAPTPTPTPSTTATLVATPTSTPTLTATPTATPTSTPTPTGTPYNWTATPHSG